MNAEPHPDLLPEERSPNPSGTVSLLSNGDRWPSKVSEGLSKAGHC